MKFSKGSATTIIIVVLALIIIGGGVWYFVANKPKACTQEAKVCPDGTTVGRTGKNCEFAECPTVKKLSVEELEKLPIPAKDIASSNFYIQNILKEKNVGRGNIWIRPVLADEGEFVSRVLVFEKGPNPREIYQYVLGGMDAGVTKRLTNDSFDDFYPAISEKNQLIYFSNRGEKTEGAYGRLVIQVRHLNLNTQENSELAKGEYLSWYPFISPSGKFAAVITDYNEITVFNLEDNSSKKYVITSDYDSGSGAGALSWHESETKIVLQLRGKPDDRGLSTMSIAELDLNSGKKTMIADTSSTEVLPQYIGPNKISYLQDSENMDQSVLFKKFIVMDLETKEKQEYSLDPYVRQTYLWSSDYNFVYFLTNEGYVSMLNVSSGEYKIVNTSDKFDGFVGWGIYPNTVLLSKFRLGYSFPCYDIYGAYNIANGESTTKMLDTCFETGGCTNKCGDGACQEVVCQAIGCPCAETIENCPQDCKKDETTDWKTYTNEKYGFEVKLPNSFNNYKINTRTDIVYDSVEYIMFQVPTNDKFSQDGGDVGFATPFIIGVYPISIWQKISSEEGPKPTKITQNDKFVFVYSQWQAPPEDLMNIDFRIPQIISTFKFIE